MKIYILFGKSGSGKSYVGDYLQNQYHWLHFDADQIITDDMKDCIRLGKKMSVEIINKYIEILKEKIGLLYKTQNKPIVISQAMYRNKNRLDLLRAFPNLQFIWVKAADHICNERIQKRNNGITVEYAQKISELFELPDGINHLLANFIFKMSIKQI